VLDSEKRLPLSPLSSAVYREFSMGRCCVDSRFISLRVVLLEVSHCPDSSRPNSACFAPKG
ncbi:hypothetical protein A2U01_0076257, partial [Trifolium medium]|nr:hypothetical protein [Trifolium medium]